jgi:hypothetical protein
LLDSHLYRALNLDRNNINEEITTQAQRNLFPSPPRILHADRLAFDSYCERRSVQAIVPADKQWHIFPPYSAIDAEKDGAQMQHFVAKSIAAPDVRNSLSAELPEKSWSKVSQGSPPRQQLGAISP